MNAFALSLLRHGLTAAGAAVVANGYADDALVEQASGAVLALVSIGWSVWERRRSQAVVQTARAVLASPPETVR